MIIFLGGLLFVKVVIGEVVIVEEFGGGDVYIWILGVVDYFVNNDYYVFLLVCNVVFRLNWKKLECLDVVEVKFLCYDIKEIYGIVFVDSCYIYDVREIIVCVVDDLDFDEFKLFYGIILVCGFVCIFGFFIGIVVNNGIFFGESVFKGVYFVELCVMWKIFFVFL